MNLWRTLTRPLNSTLSFRSLQVFEERYFTIADITT
jgi:hypothetical protein